MTNILKKLTAPLILLMIVSCYNDKFDTIDNLSLVEDNNIELKQENNKGITEDQARLVMATVGIGRLKYQV